MTIYYVVLGLSILAGIAGQMLLKAGADAPSLVAQIGFTEWTRDGLLRHPRFTGLRDDKDPREVVRET